VSAALNSKVIVPSLSSKCYKVSAALSDDVDCSGSLQPLHDAGNDLAWPDFIVLLQALLNQRLQRRLPLHWGGQLQGGTAQHGSTAGHR